MAKRGPDLISIFLSIVRMDPVIRDIQKKPSISMVPLRFFAAFMVFSGIRLKYTSRAQPNSITMEPPPK